ncbi:MAG: restriction endonuclease [Halobacteriota archaeon]
MTSRGRAHEAIVAELVDQINKEDSVQTLMVEPYKSLKGTSGATRQFDIYWEFRTEVQTHQCAIEAKHWNKPVGLRELGRLREALSDLPNPPTGILLASSGFEKGARAYAEHHGIDAWIYPFTIKTMNDDVTFFVAKFEHVSPVFDEEWIEEVLKPKLREGVPVPVNLDGTDERTHLFDEHCAAKTVRQVLHEYYLAEMTEMPAHEICVLFDKPTYIETGDLAAPMLKVSGLNAVFSLTSHTETLRRVSKDYARRAVEFIADVLMNQR